MNYLAHIYLSGTNDLLKIGNFMADSIKGHDYEKFDSEIKKGILLHRHIDSFTDMHPIYRQSKHRLHEKYGHYSGVIMDIFYDHFLAKNWTKYAEIELKIYVAEFYQSMNNHYELLSEKAQNILPYMEKQNWLLNYQSIEGIQQILTQMDRRTNNKSNMRFATEELTSHYNDFENEFTIFFEEIKNYSSQQLNSL